MRVQTMRTLDYIVGVPLCFLASLLQRLFNLFGSTHHGPPRNVLFIELSEMGSTILADPAMRKLQQATGATLYFAIFQRCRDSLRLCDTVPTPQVFTLRDTSLWTLAWDVGRFVLWTRRHRIDTVIDLELFSRVTALLTFLAGAHQRVGFYRYHHEGLYRGTVLTHKVSYNPHIHIAKNFLALVAALLAPTQELPYAKVLIRDDELTLPKRQFTAAEQEPMRARLRQAYPAYGPDAQTLVLINPNASAFLPQRRWMPEHYVALIQQILHQHNDVLIGITGAPSERAEAEAMCLHVGHERCVSLAGAFRLVELPALYSLARCMITNDSGPAHFASITDMPTFVFFGPETPALYRPLGETTPIYAGLACSPCVAATNHRKTPCHDNVCLQVITPAQVYELVKPTLLR